MLLSVKVQDRDVDRWVGELPDVRVSKRGGDKIHTSSGSETTSPPHGHSHDAIVDTTTRADPTYWFDPLANGRRDRNRADP